MGTCFNAGWEIPHWRLLLSFSLACDSPPLRVLGAPEPSDAFRRAGLPLRIRAG